MKEQTKIDSLFDSLKVEQRKKEGNTPLKLLILGFGNVAQYLYDYLLSDMYQYEIHIGTRSIDKAEEYTNCIKSANIIRFNSIDSTTELHQLDLNEVDSITALINKICPDIVINTSRYVSHLKYGSLSWKNWRAYGYWCPLSMMYVKNIAEAIKQSGKKCVFINTSYPDITNAWAVFGTGLTNPIFGAGNVNHIVARYKQAFVNLWNSSSYKTKFGELMLSDLDVLIVTSHFQDVLIGKEGKTSDGSIDPEILVKVDIHFNDEALYDAVQQFANDFRESIFEHCAIPFPSDKTRNMMVASSVFEIVNTLSTWVENTISVPDSKLYKILNIPGPFGNCGGYPILFRPSFEPSIAGERLFDIDFKEFMAINRRSLYEDGIDTSLISKGIVQFCNEEKLKKMESILNITMPRVVSYANVNDVAKMIEDAISRYLTKMN